jgi:uncharacterized protein (TIGR02466 family)
MIARDRLCANAVYYKALALARFGRVEEARKTLSTDRFVELGELPARDGLGEDRDFRERLAAEILRNPTLAPDPRGKSTLGGRQTRELRQPDSPAVAGLLEHIKGAVDGFERRLSPQSGLARVRPPKVRLDAWAVVYGAQGQQAPHRHPSGWISGVYYVAAPGPAAETGYCGPLLLGALPERDRIDPPWGIREIEPVPGRLVLFPSYVPHATAASGVDGARISVAFDVVPAQ